MVSACRPIQGLEQFFQNIFLDIRACLCYFNTIIRHFLYFLPNYSNLREPMDKDAILKKFQEGKVFGKTAFRQSVHSINPDCSEAMINWLLLSFRKKGILSSAGAGKYYVTSAQEAAKKIYFYPHSPKFLDIENQISERFPLLNFQMWELIQMNDFVNHQIAKNVIFIEAEKMMVDSVYEDIHAKHPYAMLEPDTDLFYKLRGPDVDIVVQKLQSESPVPLTNHSCTLEKIIVDKQKKKLTGKLIERSEYPAIYEGIFNKFHIDETRMFRYARRRNLHDVLHSLISEQTNIQLKTV